MFSKVLCIMVICSVFFLTSCGAPAESTSESNGSETDGPQVTETAPPVEEDTQNYLLAFVEEGSSRIRVRLTGNRTEWANAGFRDTTTDVGVGAGIEDSGFVKIVPWVTQANNLEFAWGLLQAFDKSDSDATSQAATSAPSVISQPNSATWLIAYRTTGDRIVTRIFEPQDGKGFLNFDVAPVENAANDNVNGRPALTRLGNKVVMAWARHDGSLRMAVGDLVVAEDYPIPEWTDMFAFELPDKWQDSCYSVTSEPDLTHDFEKFYLAFTRPTKRCPDNMTGESFQKETLFLYSSPDGVTWTPENPLVTSSVDLGFPSYVNIAGWADGSVYVAIVGAKGFEVRQFMNDSWTELDAAAIFGHTPKSRQFALVLGGHPGNK